MSNLMLDVDQAGELKAAFRRGNWTNGQIKALCEGNILVQVRKVLEGKAEIICNKAVRSGITLMGKINVPSVLAKNTSDCFREKLRYFSRDADLDKCLPQIQQEQPGGSFSVYTNTQTVTYKKVFETCLRIKGNIDVISKKLKDRQYTTTLPVIESLVERQEKSEEVMIGTEFQSNCFFVESPTLVLVVVAFRFDRLWYVAIDSIDNPVVWPVGTRFFFRN